MRDRDVEMLCFVGLVAFLAHPGCSWLERSDNNLVKRLDVFAKIANIAAQRFAVFQEQVNG